MNKLKLWLDDDPRRDAWMIPDEGQGWTIARTVEDAKLLVQGTSQMGMAWGEASLDNDLGTGAPGGDGVSFLNWMIENDIWPETKPEVHSYNPVAARRMKQDIERWGPYE